MPFTIRETLGGWSHMLARMERRLIGRAPDHYFQKLARQDNPFVLYLDDPAQLCPFCGFVVAKMILPGGFTVETCSAAGRGILAGKSLFRRFAESLSRPPAAPAAGAAVPAATGAGDLPGDGG